MSTSMSPCWHVTRPTKRSSANPPAIHQGTGKSRNRTYTSSTVSGCHWYSAIGSSSSQGRLHTRAWQFGGWAQEKNRRETVNKETGRQVATGCPCLLATCLPATCLLPPAPCFLPLASCFLPPAPCFLLPASCPLLPASCFLLPASCLLLPASCLLPPASCLLPPAPCLLHLLTYFPWPAFLFSSSTSMRRRILPTAVLGRLSRNSTAEGTLYLAILPLQNSMISSSVAVSPAFRIT